MSIQDKDLSRRQVIQASSAITAGVILAGPARAGFAQESTPAASPEVGTSAIPDGGTETQTRGEGGELRILQWQAPTTLLRYRSSGVKDYLPGSLVMEPLYVVLADGTIAPQLTTEVPTKEAGTLADDLTWVTVTLKKGLLWSDGEPVTSEDIRFTWEWNVNSDNLSLGSDTFAVVSDVEIVDERTATFHFTGPNPIWVEVISGSGGTVLLPQHLLSEHSPEVNDAFGLNPVGTGPFVVESFVPNDEVRYVANENYRDANKPYFSSVLIKGGGDAAAAARAVLTTGDFDFAWNIQAEPEAIEPLQTDDAFGILEVTPNVSLETLDLNQSDPRTEVDGEVSQKDTPHPFFSDLRVRQAIAWAIPRQQISENLFLEGNPPAANIIVGNPEVDSPNNTVEFDLEAANALLDEAGWEWDGDYRKKDGQEFEIVFATAVNSVRQKSQVLIQAALQQIGIKVILEQIDAGQFFDRSAGNPQNLSRFPWDLQQYARNITSVRPLRYLNSWYWGPNGENVAQKVDSWSGANFPRWHNEDYDAELEAARVETDDNVLVERLIKLNDLVVQDVASIPLIQVGTNVVYSRKFAPENFGFSPFEYHYWNIANWRFSEEG